MGNHREAGLPGRLLLGGLAGIAADAAGTTALNTATYLDMVLRGRGTSSAPEDTVEELSDRTDVTIPGDENTRENRVEGMGPLLGILTGLGVGAVAGALRAAGVRLPFPVSVVVVGAGAMAGSDGPMTVLGISDPRTWATTDWVADAIPHLAYGLVVDPVLRAIDA